MREARWRSWRPGQEIALAGLASVIGHRGSAAHAPENTLAGLRRAHQLGARWVEFDVMLSADGVPILIHDESLDRTTNGRGRVANHSAAQLAALDAGAWFGPEFAGEHIQTLAQAVAALLELKLGANVEIKPAAGHGIATGRSVAEFLDSAWPDDGPPLLLSSFDRGALGIAQQVAPAIPRGLLAGPLPRDWAEAMRGLDCASLHLDHRRVASDTLRSLADQRVPVLFYTVNDGNRARQLLADGAQAVITDRPGELTAALERSQ